jgi:hypothetical protein
MGVETALAAGAIAAPVVGGLIGADQANSARSDANNLRSQALSQFANLSAPDIEQMKLNLEQYSSAGTLTPEMIQQINLGNTALEGVSTDPRLKQSQMQALQNMTQIANTGMSSADQAAYELARRNAASEAQAKQNQILQNMQARGQGGSGAELLASLQNTQSSADRLQQAQLEQAKAAQQARMQALQNQASMSSNVRSQDYNEASALANAKDAISKFNAQNAQNVGTLNTQTKNQAQQSNLTNAQNLRNNNTGLSNEQQKYNKGLLQQDFTNKRQLAGDKANALTGGAQAKETQAGQTAGMWSGVGQGVGGVLGAFAKS